MSDRRHAFLAGPLLVALVLLVAATASAEAGAKKKPAPAKDDLTALIRQLEREDRLTTASISRKSRPAPRVENAELSFGAVDDGHDRSYSIVDPSQRANAIPTLGLNLKMGF
ncbi:MAG: hypothetical protein AB7S41_12805 [Parvibaculaceae bacterium]